MSRKWVWGSAVTLLLVFGAFGGGLWSASTQVLFPAWRGAKKDLSLCWPELARYWGESCGNLRASHAFHFSEVRVPALNGYDLPGWLISTQDNDLGPAEGAIVLIHGGGSDRRELTRFVHYYLRRHLDVLTLDLSCHGEAPCPAPGLTYGQRESRDVFSAYLFLRRRYDKVLAMGSSVGAAAILVSLPEMPDLKGVIAENPLTSFQKLIAESPAARPFPGWFTQLLIKLTLIRGRFDGLMSPEHSVRFAQATPVFFIHSMRDNVVPVQQTQALAEAYTGPKTTWFPDKGEHGAIWDVDHADYERRLTAFLNTTPQPSAPVADRHQPGPFP